LEVLYNIKKPPRAGNGEGIEHGRLLIKKLNAEKKAREKRKFEVMMKKELEFKKERE
jgi:hypothetical protein